MRSVLAVVAILAILAAFGAHGLTLHKMHLVDHHADHHSFLFRGDEPIVGGKGNWSFDYPLLVQYMRTRAGEKNLTLPEDSKLYILDITFENALNSGFHTEEEFWKDPANAAKGAYKQWLLVGDLVHPSEVSPHERKKMIDDGEVWDIDQIPTRVVKMREILLNGPPAGYDAIAVYVHCQGGCDRTGEFIASYRMAYQYAPKLATQYELDCQECGRCPNWFATGGIGWYCLTWNMYNSSTVQPPLPDCLTAYNCSLLDHGQPCDSTGN